MALHIGTRRRADHLWEASGAAALDDRLLDGSGCRYATAVVREDNRKWRCWRVSSLLGSSVIEQSALAEDSSGERPRDRQESVKLRAGPDQDVRRDSDTPERPMGELRATMRREVGGWDDDHQVVIAVGLTIAACP
jgi:hypothetical protein